MVYNLRILVVGSCGKKKRSMSLHSPVCKDIPSKDSLRDWRSRFPKLLHHARDMYTGNQTREDFYILSAGFGLLKENDLVPPYDCSFIGMRKNEIRARAEALSISEDFRKILETHYNLAYLALGEKYLLALGKEWPDYIDCITIIFGKRHSNERIIFLPANKEIVMAFSKSGFKIHGIAGFKGDLFRILAIYANQKKSPYKAVSKWAKENSLPNLIYKLGNLGSPPQLIQTSINTDST
jgi:hypothetical protein